LQRVPALSVPLHCTVEFSPFALLVDVISPLSGGLQILQAVNPNSFAFDAVIFSETFFTLRQVARWYFSPDGVLYTV